MKINATVTLTLLLLSFMVGAGVMTAAWGYVLGREALKGITQPDVRPVGNLNEGQGGRKHGLTFLNEQDILAAVKARMDGAQPEVSAEPAPAEAPTATEVATTTQPGLPISSQAQGVTLKVDSVQPQGELLVMNVSLQNDGSRPVQFLYRFMDVTNDQGRLLSANTEGLPEELPPGGESFSGVVTVPTSLLEGANTLSLSLTDYPDQRLQLQLSGIPIVR